MNLGRALACGLLGIVCLLMGIGYANGAIPSWMGSLVPVALYFVGGSNS